jgi:hypothetical protein
MQLYNSSLSRGLRNYARFLTNTNTTTFSDADLNAAINFYYHDIVNEILASMDGWDFQGETATADIVSGQAEYILPTDILKIKKIDVTYDGTNWASAKFFDVSEKKFPLDGTTVARAFSQNAPEVDLYDSSIFLYPTPSANVIAGIKIYYEKEVSELSADTDEPVFAEAYHKVLVYGAAKDYLEKYAEVDGNTNKRNLQQQNFNRLMDEMRLYYNTRNQDRDYNITPYDVNYDYDPNN